ncbi:hypothetical protein [Streptomyces sp. NBC_01235]|uniref:hypothetical protein n=1 Tax=Streptomyces sp. NBC_01235 TaxID=2903788 RepID=UPI002E0DE60D|nr:hypothetical protein OG289_42185 [Streptomyces sp. NBC_01235]
MTHWLAAGGTLLVVMGSAAQAWFAVMEYRDLLDSTHTTDAVRKMFTLTGKARSIFGLLTFLPAAIDAARTMRAMIQALSEVTRQGGENARRLTELSRTYLGWVTVLFGATAVFASAVIELAVDYGDATYAIYAAAGFVALALVAARVVRRAKARRQ